MAFITPLLAFGAETLVASYPILYHTAFSALSSTGNLAFSESFKPDQTVSLSSISFYLRRQYNPSGNIYAKLYSHTGVYGTSSKPGALLATSNPIDIMTISSTTAQVMNFTFPAGQNYLMQEDSPYTAVIEFTGGNSTNYLFRSYSSIYQIHLGNQAYYVSSWTAQATSDTIFYVYGKDGKENDQPIKSYNSDDIGRHWLQRLSIATADFQRNDITSIKVRAKLSETANFRAIICKSNCGDNYPTGITGENIFDSYYDGAYHFTPDIQPNVYTDYILSVATASSTNPAYCYTLDIFSEDPQTNFNISGSNDSDSYPYGNVYNSDGLEDSTVKDIYMMFNPEPTTDTINIIYPVNNSVDVQPFSYYRGQYTNNYSRVNGYDFELRVSTSSTPFLSNDAYISTFSDLDFTASSTKDWQAGRGSFINDVLNQGETYYSQIRMGITDSGIWTATSSINKFTMAPVLNDYISDTSTTGALLNTAVTASTTPYGLNISCDAQTGLSWTTCILSSFLFTPHEAILNNWSNLKNVIIKKPPFGYFTIYQNAFLGITTSTTTKAFLLADLSDLDTDLFDPLKTGISMVLIISFVFGVFTRLKHLQL